MILATSISSADQNKIMPSVIQSLCKKNAEGIFTYLLPPVANGSGIRSHPDCDAMWSYPNGTVIATLRPHANVTAPAVLVDEDRLFTDRCVNELFYRMECLSRFSEEFHFHGRHPAADNGNSGNLWSILIPVLVVVLLLCVVGILLFCKYRKGRRTLTGKDPSHDVDKCCEELLP